MLKNILFDFGDIFINLDKQAMSRELEKYGIAFPPPFEFMKLCNEYEVGAISTEDFVTRSINFFTALNSSEIVRIWNSILLDFPDYRLDFLEQMAAEDHYRLFLLSNTNALHIEKVIKIMGQSKFDRFKACFERFYLSHEIRLRKPNANVYEFVLHQNQLSAKETLFIDDTEQNTAAAAELGIRVWNLQVGKEDIVQLKSRLP